DLVVTTWGSGIHLMRNDGGFTFTEVTQAAGLTEFAATRGVSWADIDGDGWIDMFVCNYLNAIPNTANAKNRVWRNLGNGTFTDIAPQLGMDDTAYSFMTAIFDADLDGDLDIYLSNDRAMFAPFKPNRFFRNDGGVFTDVGPQNGTALTFFSMGIACGDLDGNGLPDLYCTNLPTATPPLMGENPLMLQHPNGMFTQEQVAWGVQLKKTSWACIFFDVDNDADTDLYVVNQLEGNALFQQRARPPMVNIAVQANIAGPSGTVSMDYCASVADVDGDGDLDVIQNNLASNVRLFINNDGATRQWARFLVVGERHDTRGLGTTVRVRTGEKWQLRQLMSGGNGYLSQNDGLLHFGLDAATVMDEIHVRWPYTGTARTLTNYPARQRWRLLPPARLGDSDNDGAVTQADLSAFALRLSGPFTEGKEIFDFDGNGSLGAADIAAFNERFSGLRGDFDGNGVVEGPDLGALLQHWGAAPSAYDLNLDGKVDGADLGILLGNWE
ncbi:MAG: VCBS repeat-containing protein, partial [Phycisphaerae bacterium]|nr:VCBS repeat-containing protein [Phycisphaerae bacterium]